MEKIKRYANTKFPGDIIELAKNTLIERNPIKKDTSPFTSYSIDFGKEEWDYDSEKEYFADYRKSIESSNYRFSYSDVSLIVGFYDNYTKITVKAKNREEIESVFEIFEKNVKKSKISKPKKPPKPKPKIFIGHGRSPLWRNLKDHLHEKHDYSVEAYEIGARAGHAIRDVLENMLESSSFAILVMTAEDETKKGKKLPRQNVVHEVGLFQGKLGFDKAIVLLERGTQEFSNIKGIEQIRFKKGNIKETFGDVLATLKREFPK